MRVGEVGGNTGFAKVVSSTNNEVILKIEQLQQPPLKSLNLSIVLALPRPQMLKRILQAASIFAVDNVYLVSANRVEKSYFHSPVLADSSIREFLLLGLEQGGHTRLPNVKVYPRFNLKKELPDLINNFSNRFVAHPSSAKTFLEYYNEVSVVNSPQALVAIGPEGGWIDDEIQEYELQGFKPLLLGKSILSVEVAVIATLSQFAMINGTSVKL